LIGCQRVTDRQTDVQPISIITFFSIADARKNVNVAILRFLELFTGSSLQSATDEIAMALCHYRVLIGY